MIIADTDFLSAFLKIDRLNLIFDALETDEIVIARAVLHELEQAPTYSGWLEALHAQKHKIIVRDAELLESEDLGRGEMESISLAEKFKALLLMDDRKAAALAKSRGITVVDIPTFLLHCKSGNLLSLHELKQIIQDLKDKDYYEFTEEVKERLLKI